MKMKPKRLTMPLLFMLCALLLASCATTEPLTLDVTQVDGTRGAVAAAQSAGGLQMIVAPDIYDGSNASFLVSLAATDDQSHIFLENDVALYGGDFQKNQWTLISRWSSSDYLRKIDEQRKASKIAIGVFGTLAVIDALLNPDSSGDWYVQYPIYSVSPYGHFGYSYSVSGSGPVAAALIAVGAIETSIAMDQLSEMYQAEVNRTILRNASVMKGQPLSGNIHFSAIPKYPDYKIVYNDMQFLFSRSDREEIVHPWKDRKSDIFAMTYTNTIGTRRNSIKFSYLAPRYMGYFIDVSFFPELTHIEKQNRYIGSGFGLNFKVSPYTWLQGGVEFQRVSSNTEDYDILCLMGVTFSANYLNFYGGAAYSVNDNEWYAELGAGISF